ncbi:hypothetical protein [Nocardia cyriacigeorgica]|uniref:hypothetical protein n=1 Tax=Nocardia cyriacigeorgica TaxID=135487 RepID=UPI002457FFD0|nr:hypothetical protein [Nocardia cyriacigeorgica]
MATFMTIVMLLLLREFSSAWVGATMFLVMFPTCSASYGYLTVLVIRKNASDKEVREQCVKVSEENERLWEQHDHFYSNNFMLPKADRLR